MTLWIFVTFAAALFQTLRFMLQRQLVLDKLNATGATFARFVYSSPLILIGTAGYFLLQDLRLPPMGMTFWLYATMGGLAQILATIAVVQIFKERNFAVGVTFTKTETLQVVVLSLLLLGEGASIFGLLAILTGLVGVVLLSVPPDSAAGATLWNRAAGLGLASGFFFAISSVCYRGASLELALPDAWARAALTLAAVTLFQTVIMAVWLGVRETVQLRAVWQARRVAIWIGILSMAGSFCWFVAFTLQNAAYVRAVGQIELVLSLLASLVVFRETIQLREWLGIGIILISVIGIVLSL